MIHTQRDFEGVAEELLQCGFENVNITFTDDIEKASHRSEIYRILGWRSPQGAGMTREDLLRGNSQIAEDFGKNVRKYCPDVKHIVVIFNPADITGLVTLLYSGVKPSLRNNPRRPRQHTSAQRARPSIQDFSGHIVNARTYTAVMYGGKQRWQCSHPQLKWDGKPPTQLIEEGVIPEKEWEDLKVRVIQGGKNIIDLRGRSFLPEPGGISLHRDDRGCHGRSRFPLAGRVSMSPTRNSTTS